MVLQPTRDDLRIAWLTALAVSIHLLESALPSPLPGVKPGLANVITVAVLIYFGWAMAAWISLLRVTAGSVLLGTFLSPTFVLSLSGAVASIFVLGLVTLSTGRTLLGPVGYSILASMAHVSGQFAVAYLLFIPHPGLFRLLPIVMSAALLFGVLSGIIAHHMLRKLAHP
ncbi:MAG: Gx transporter family protein [Gammaproteobacteria bacterium]|nr:Gx transporter family protein [Gammaproteobacteria bacterium]